jgi:hypothetical protein
MIDRTSRLSVMLEAQQWDAVLNALADGPYRVTAPLIAEIQRQCMQQEHTAVDSGAALAARRNGEVQPGV